MPGKLKPDTEGDKKATWKRGILECVVSFVQCFADETDRNLSCEMESTVNYL